MDSFVNSSCASSKQPATCFLEFETDVKEICVFQNDDRVKLHGGILEEEFFVTKQLTDFHMLKGN